ncbi:MAG: hypothetical protein HFH41_06985 [Lachnospiraceae bacterium]|nr:hypothetical protein [Lachnospiraceae bacterium]
MEYNAGKGEVRYFKVIVVKIPSDEYGVIKGPEEEKCLAGILQSDHNSTRYEKMIQLLAAEMVQKEYQKEFRFVFSLENIKREFQKGKSVIEYSYMRNIEGELKMADTRVYPRAKNGEELEEFMVYVTTRK